MEKEVWWWESFYISESLRALKKCIISLLTPAMWVNTNTYKFASSIAHLSLKISTLIVTFCNFISDSIACKLSYEEWLVKSADSLMMVVSFSLRLDHILYFNVTVSHIVGQKATSDWKTIFLTELSLWVPFKKEIDI